MAAERASKSGINADMQAKVRGTGLRPAARIARAISHGPRMRLTFLRLLRSARPRTRMTKSGRRVAGWSRSCASQWRETSSRFSRTEVYFAGIHAAAFMWSLVVARVECDHSLRRLPRFLNKLQAGLVPAKFEKATIGRFPQVSE